MRHLLFVAVIAFASASGAVTLSVSSDKLTYLIGETVTLSINGDAQGASASGIFGRLVFNGALVDLTNLAPAANCFPGNSHCTASQKLIGPGFTKASLEAADTDVFGVDTAYAEAIDQLHVSVGVQTATNPISTVYLIAMSVGEVPVAWDTTSLGNQLDFFGLTSAPGTGFCIVGDGDPCSFIPEPATGALFALGLLALAFVRRST